MSICKKLFVTHGIIIFIFLLVSFHDVIFAQVPTNNKISLINISKGWASTSINTVIFRYNSVVSFKNFQYAAFYDSEANVVLAKRKIGTRNWTVKKTKYNGNVKDAHNCISIMIDGQGYLHMSWDQHGNQLKYCRSKYPESLELTDDMPMTGNKEKSVTYPQFYKLPDGNLIFLYRDGESGNGNLVINFYNTRLKKWSNLHYDLIDGEGKRNAYWQAAVDTKGTIHISWVWRESPDVSTNHDICYAKSTDGGISWCKSNGEKYILPVTAENAEYIAKIPQGSGLINQTSMCTDTMGYPYISSYWTLKGNQIPQYYVIYYNGSAWKIKQVSQRSSPNVLSGRGTKRIPMSRPQILIDKKNTIFIIFRDIERQNRVSAAVCSKLEENKWDYKDLTSFSVDMWEPTYDTELWKIMGDLNLFIQKVGQGDAEKIDPISSQIISILEWHFKN